jgi:hypothetical protein
MESLRTTRADRVQEEEEEESGDEDGEVSHREGENDSEEAKVDAKKFKVGPGQLAVLATALDSLVNKIASSIIPSQLPHRFPFPPPQSTSPLSCFADLVSEFSYVSSQSQIYPRADVCARL